MTRQLKSGCQLYCGSFSKRMALKTSIVPMKQDCTTGANPDGSLCYAYEQLSGSKKSMDCITVLCCINITGKDKVKLLMIGKSKKLWCFKGICRNTQPVMYRVSQNA